MFPVLMIDGIAHKVLGIDWDENGVPSIVKIRVNNEWVFYWNAAISPGPFDSINFDEHLLFVNQYGLILQTLNDLIKLNQERMRSLAFDYIRHDYLTQPIELKLHFDNINIENETLKSAINIINDFTKDDVDSSD